MREVPRPPSPRPAGDHRPNFSAPFELDRAKLRVPLFRQGIVARTALLDRLTTSPSHPVVAVVAPAGYGKTTILAQWAERKQPRVAWLSLDRRDNDPAVLLTYLAEALNRVQPTVPMVPHSLPSPGSGMADVARLVSPIAAIDEPVAVVLDGADALVSRECRDIVAELAARLPFGSQLAIGSRHEPPVAVARLRAQGRIAEIGTHDLAMDVTEAAALLLGAGVELPDAELHALVERTEGWPAGLYLAALALSAGGPSPPAGFTFTGDDRFMGDYLRSEFLERVSRADVAFLTRTSILDALSGPVCDHVVGRKGSGRVLDRLERRNLLVIPLDRRRERYRYHHLFRDLLHAELMQREPETVPELHRRAAAWYEANDLPETAIEHAQEAGDPDLVARLVFDGSFRMWASGRIDSVLRWLGWIADKGRIDSHPALAVHGANFYAMVGDPSDAERWASVAERTSFTGTLPDGSTMEALLAYLRANACRDGPDAMSRDARVALHGLGPTSPYRAAALSAEGAAQLIRGDPEQAEALFVRAVDEATRTGATPYIPILQFLQGLASAGRGDRPAAESLAHEALVMVQDVQFEGSKQRAVVFAWNAHLASRRGEVSRASDLVTRAARLRPSLTYSIPITSVLGLLELARAYIALGDAGGARAALRQVRDIEHQRPHLGVLAAQADEIRTTLETLRGELVGVSSLTTAELRVLSLLPTHLSFAEIGERLFVSRNTVKSQVHSIYRKLGASGRGETVTRMHELGLLNPT
jgi:LuxR family maltose regulon positive regulatory protein